MAEKTHLQRGMLSTHSKKNVFCAEVASKLGLAVPLLKREILASLGDVFVATTFSGDHPLVLLSLPIILPTLVAMVPLGDGRAHVGDCLRYLVGNRCRGMTVTLLAVPWGETETCDAASRVSVPSSLKMGREERASAARRATRCV